MSRRIPNFIWNINAQPISRGFEIPWDLVVRLPRINIPLLDMQDIWLFLDIGQRFSVFGRRQLLSTHANKSGNAVGVEQEDKKLGVGIYDDVIKWRHFPHYCPFVRGIHQSPVNSPHKGQWRGALMFSLICARINRWVNNREAGDLRRQHAHYDVTVIYVTMQYIQKWCKSPGSHRLAIFSRDHFVYAPSKWKTTLQWNVVSLLLSTCRDWALFSGTLSCSDGSAIHLKIRYPTMTPTEYNKQRTLNCQNAPFS